MGWRTKFDEPSVKSLYATYSQNKGLALGYEVRPTKKTELDLRIETKSQILKGEWTFKPEDKNQ